MAPRRAGPAPMSGSAEIWNELELKNGGLQLVLLPGIGGRLWDIALNGASLLFRNPDLVGMPADPDRLTSLPTRSPHFPFPLWGGEKTWIAPDSAWPEGGPHPVLDSGSYRVVEQSDNAVEMVSAPCPVSQLVVTRRITLNSPTSFDITHRVRNTGTEARRTGIWSVMMLSHPARIAIQAMAPDIRPVFGESGPNVGPVDFGISCACEQPREYKVALPNPAGRVLIQCPQSDIWMLCRTPDPQPHDDFAHGSPFEVFNSGDYPYCEAEWHSPCENLEPGAEISFEQTFHVWQGEALPQGLELSDELRELKTCMS